MNMKKTLWLLLATLLLLNVCCITSYAITGLQYEDIVGSWYGQYTGHSGGTFVERYMNMTVTECDEKGNFKGESKITTVEGQGYDYEWFNYEFTGKMDLEKNTFYMKGNKITSGSSGTIWSTIPFSGEFYCTDSGELYVEGIANNDSNRKFYFGRTSAWSMSEVTEANMHNLIPETLKKKDLSKPVTRAEFAAISVQLYEKLTEQDVSVVKTPFTDIAGSEDASAIAKAYGVGITDGVAQTQFAPTTNINREQLATMLCRTIKAYTFPEWTLSNDANYYLDTSGVTKFADDGDISDYAKPSVYYLTKLGIIKGIDATHFAPRNISPRDETLGYATATREQAIALSLRIFKISDMWK